MATSNSNSTNSYTYTSNPTKRYPRLSRPLELLRPTYDVVVIGSGYGGGVAASRMARAGLSVCVLERGKERWPGEYPTTLSEAGPQVHVSGDPSMLGGGSGDRFAKKLISQSGGGDPTGLYHLVLGEGQNAFVGNGLGGTSLLNANIFLRADEGTLGMREWPAEIREDPGCLEHYYTLAEQILEPTPYPASSPPLPKLELLRAQAQLLGWESKFYRPPQTTRFADGANSVGVEMRGSELTGMDCTGVNDGSKGSVLVNYLADAWNWGAEMFCETEVRYLRPHPSGEGYTVFFAWHGGKRGKFKQNLDEDLMWVRAKKFVFLGAGTLGTTEILLRSREAGGLKCSEMVGRGMSGNGDILAFGYNTDYKANAIGRAHPSPSHPIGPTITGVIDCRAQKDPLDGFVIEEGAVPESLAPLLQPLLESTPHKILPPNLTLAAQARHFVSRQASRVLGPYWPDGSLERTQIYLIMSHDSNQAVLTLRGDKPALKFLGVGRSAHVEYLNGVLAKATGGVGGTFVDSPFYAAFGQKEITVHPIGGANMSRDGTASRGATNHMGQVLTGNGSECHEGLVCVDGSVVPTALGVNPFATITALAERSVALVAREGGVEIDYDTKNGILDLFGRPAHVVPQEGNLVLDEELIRDAKAAGRNGIEFTEVMEGFIHLGDDIQDFLVAEKTARGAASAARFFLTVHSWDENILLDRSDHSAMLTGTFTHGGLSDDSFMVLRGKFQLFNEDSRTPDTKNLTYNFDMQGTDGEIIHFNGYKVVNQSSAFSIWKTWEATSTLYVTLSRPDKSVIGRGVLHIKPLAFVSELATFTPSGPSVYETVKSAAGFLGFFSKQVASVLFAPFASLEWPSVTASGYMNKPSPAHRIEVVASDGVTTEMLLWLPPPGTKQKKTPLLFIPGASVDHQVFSLPTIRRNAVDYFTEAGYRVYILTHRVGRTPVAQQGWTTYDARLDILAALLSIRTLEPTLLSAPPSAHGKIYVVAHCAGSVALASGLLDGTIPTEYLAGITASNVFLNPIFSSNNKAKASVPHPLTTGLYSTLARTNWYPCASSPTEPSWTQAALNQGTRFFPQLLESRHELCSSVTCHRSSLAFGRLWSHKNLNEATHAAIPALLGGVSMPALEHLMSSGTRGLCLGPAPSLTPLTTPENIARLAGVPVFLFSGSENAVYSPEATERDYEVLCRIAGGAGGSWTDYERWLFEGWGHLDCWMGERAAGVVYPRVEAHLGKVCGAD